MNMRFAMLIITFCLVSATGVVPTPVQGEQARKQQSAVAKSSTDAVTAAVALYRRGKYEQGLATLAQDLQRQGDGAPPEIRMNAALCALRLLHSRDAEQFAASLVEDSEWSARASFVLGLAAAQHAERAVVAANLADAEPMAWMMATRAIRTAELQFRQVVSLAPEWHEATRNLEHILRRKDTIAAASAAAQPPDAKKEQQPKPEPKKDPNDQKAPPEIVVPEIAATELTSKELRELQELVRQQQDKKVRGRQQRSGSMKRSGQRDW